jgi:hypothetical protein
MKTTFIKTCALWAALMAVGGVCAADVLLDDTFADASRAETNLPHESAVWVSHPDGVTMGVGSLAFDQNAASGSQKMWTYFAYNQSPVSLAVGDTLIATIEFTPRGALYETTSKTFRFGLFYDPTDDQVLEDINSDTGNGCWTDSTGYAVHFPLSSGPSGSNASVGKRVTGLSDSLLGSGSAYPGISSGGDPIVVSIDTPYTLTLELERPASDQMRVTFTIADTQGVLSTHSILDDGTFGGYDTGIYTQFDQLFFRFSSAAGTADVLDFHRIKVEHILGEEPPYEGTPVGIPYEIYAAQSCRTEIQNPDTNRTDSSKLSVRSDEKAAKSWIKFDLGDLDPNTVTLKSATLTITLLEPKGGSNTVDISAVNDACRENIDWTETTITWNNAPGNLTDSQQELDPAKTTFVATVSITDGLMGDAFTVDVLPILQADSDGIVQFVLHNSSALLNFCTHDYAIPEYRPVLHILVAPEGADNPVPYLDAAVSTDLAELKWKNPEPNEPYGQIFCDVYLGTEPNRPQMDKVSVGPDVSRVAINTTNFPTFGTLVNKTTYYWIVDCLDTSRGPDVIEGLLWSFYTDDNEPPVVDAGPDQAVWLGMDGIDGQVTVALEGYTADDGRPGPYVVLWTQDQTEAPPVGIVNADQDVATVTLTERGVYAFTLTADDGEKQAFDTVQVVVGDTPCDASHMSSGQPYLPGDINQDCIVNLEDFALLFAQGWLSCTDMLTHCGL